jgi:hypothetical protein
MCYGGQQRLGRGIRDRQRSAQQVHLDHLRDSVVEHLACARIVSDCSVIDINMLTTPEDTKDGQMHNR